MREIKFRAWDWQDMRENNNSVLRDMIEYNYKSESHKNYIFMQYTGLKDKNWKEIYEGDVVVFYRDVYKDSRIIGKEERIGYIWHSDKFFYCIRHKDQEFHISYAQEVIGNIYQNPDIVS